MPSRSHDGFAFDPRGKIDVLLAKHSHARALKIGARPLEFFDPPDLRGQTESSLSNKLHASREKTLSKSRRDDTH
jgi:hypothetical protein